MTELIQVKATAQAEPGVGGRPNDAVAGPAEPNGGAVAALVSAGLGCAVLGVLVVLAEASAPFEGLMTFYAPAGSLTGKTTVPVIVWLMAWGLLHSRLKDCDLDFARGLRLTAVLVGIGLLGTFPPFFGLFVGSE